VSKKSAGIFFEDVYESIDEGKPMNVIYLDFA